VSDDLIKGVNVVGSNLSSHRVSGALSNGVEKLTLEIDLIGALPGQEWCAIAENLDPPCSSPHLFPL